jgi:hypothetical protein
VRKIDFQKRSQDVEDPSLNGKRSKLLVFKLDAACRSALNELLARAKANGYTGPIKSAVIRQAILDTAARLPKNKK